MNLSISKRLAMMSIAAVLMLLLVGLIGYSTARKITADMEYTSENVIRRLGLLGEVESSFLLIRVHGVYHIAYDSAAKKAAHEAVIKQETEDVHKNLAAYEKGSV